MLRQIAVVAVLFGIMTLLPALFEAPTGAVNAVSMAAFGFIVLAAYTLGELAERIRLPHITGYLVAGLVCGPHLLGLLDDQVVQDLKLFDALAVALIGISAGGALKIGALRRGLHLVAGVIVAQFLAIMLGIGLLVGLLSLPIPGLGLGFLVEGDWARILAVALLLGTIASAFSPAATIAVINGVRARGAVTENVLGISILNNVVVVAVFAATLAAGQRLVGADAGDTRLIIEVLSTLGGSLGLGLVLGVVLMLHLRFVGTHLLLLVVGLCFIFTWIAQQTGTEPVLVFIVAGFIFANASPRSEQLFTVVDRLSLPVYVVFFFIAGAGLHVDALKVLWPAALLLFAGRMGSLHLGTLLGTRLLKGPDGLGRYGWMAFGPQAGIALSLAMVAGHAFPEWGGTLETLAVATIGLNELVGPALLQASLGLVGEARADRGAGAHGESDAEDTRDDLPVPDGSYDRGVPEWLPEPGRPRRDPWGPAPITRSRRLRELVDGLRGELQAVVRDLRAGPVSRRREQAARFLGLLRREFLRAHRHTTLSLVSTPDELAWRAALRRERAELARRWEQLLLDRAATTDFRQDLLTFQGIVAAVDRCIEGCPEALEVPLEAGWAEPRDDDPYRLAVARWRLRTRRRLLTPILGAREETRAVELRALARYCLSGQAPTNLVEAGALIALGERHLLSRARAVFDSWHQALEQLLSSQLSVEERRAALESIRVEMEEDFTLASREVDRIADDIIRVTASALGRAYRELVGMVDRAGTAELPQSGYRFSRAFDGRQRALRQLDEGFAVSRELTRGIASTLAMELEMVRLGVHIREAVDEAAQGLGRDVHGKLHVQLRRLSEALGHAIANLRSLLSGESRQREELREGIQQGTGPLSHVLADALAIGEKLRTALKHEAALEPLLRSLNSGIDDLTDRFLVVVDAPPPQGRGFPSRAQTRDLHFREAVRSYMEAEAGRDLSEALSELCSRVDEAYVGIDEVQRVLAFNADLSGAELEVLPGDQVPDETLELLREMLVGTLQRLANRVDGLLEVSAPLGAEAERGVRRAVAGNLERLTGILVEGRHNELKLRLALESASAGGREITGVLREVSEGVEQLGKVIAVALGPQTAERIRGFLGVPAAEDLARPGPGSFAPPAERVPIPTVYRRLFSDQGLEGGDLLSGRDSDVERARRALLGRGGGVNRSLVVVGVAGLGNTTVVNALVRGLPDQAKIHRVQLSHCLRPQEVEAQILWPARGGRDNVVVVEGFHWLFSIRPGGFDALRLLMEGIIADRGRNAWLISTQRPVWSYVTRVLPLQDVFCEHFDLGPQSVEELRSTLLLRHAMSGYRLHFERPPGHLGWWLRELITRKSAEEELIERDFFDQLHRSSGGILSDALRLWLAAVAGVGTSTDTITIGALPEPPLEPMRRLPLDVLLTLRQVARQARITPEDHASQFRREIAWSSAYLVRLEHWGLLGHVDDCCYHLAPELAGAIHQVLRDRGLVG